MAKSGETNKLEMISARSQRLEVGNQLYEVSSDLGINRQKLKVLLNISYLPVPSDTILHRIDDSFISDSMSFERNPTLGYMLNQVEVKKIEKKIERNQALPGLNLGYFSQTILGTQEIGGSTRDFGPGYRFTGFQAGISVPLWFPSYTARSKAAGINESLARTDAEFFRKSLYGNYRSMVDEYRKYSSTVNYYETQAIPEAELIIKQATLSYRAGALDYLDFAIMINRAIAIKMDYLEAMNNLNQAIISIEYVYGKIF